ncbi:CPCC family cysteine-rich protein [Noviherbaspirillum humi]|uniref:CPCC family cysteine-rich protein n=1 Tax=Noviherbaspirillum humi TaxID=1688639 RepID=UPI000B77D35A|nr:CPCC family cysteine-rich protein [Noviherbaspirillum humi]
MTKSDNNQHLLCPCCGQRTISEPGAYEICSVCGWEDDPVQSADPKYTGGANRESLESARALWQKKGRPYN